MTALLGLHPAANLTFLGSASKSPLSVHMRRNVNCCREQECPQLERPFCRLSEQGSRTAMLLGRKKADLRTRPRHRGRSREADEDCVTCQRPLEQDQCRRGHGHDLMSCEVPHAGKTERQKISALYSRSQPAPTTPALWKQCGEWGVVISPGRGVKPDRSAKDIHWRIIAKIGGPDLEGRPSSRD
jgi:hypothetical protein